MSPAFEQLIGRAVVNKAFRDKLLADPDDAVKEAGFALTDDEIKDLKANIRRFKSQIATDILDQHLQAQPVQALRW
jgi:hypothetical protein